MDILTLALLLTAGAYILNARQQRKHIVLLATHLHHYQIEKLMEALTEGYLRALGESTPERSEQIWQLLHTTEAQLCEQFRKFAAEFAKEAQADTCVSRFLLPIPLAATLFPAATFDMRKMLVIHARGIANAADRGSDISPRDRAFTMSAELFLMQHSCHWFCKSRMVASARMLARHQTPHEQLIASVSPQTRSAYLALIQGE
ncbi:MAG: hypothetical protein K2Q11_02020 [Burkholderiaceae bacterium]|nr:hypothetical protein [Burkholderiaceae bacterium]